MSVLVALALLLAIVLVGVGLRADYLAWRAHRDAGRVQRQLRSRQGAIDAHARMARRAMNQAAGQSWRNPFE